MTRTEQIGLLHMTAYKSCLEIHSRLCNPIPSYVSLGGLEHTAKGTRQECNPSSAAVGAAQYIIVIFTVPDEI